MRLVVKTVLPERLKPGHREPDRRAAGQLARSSALPSRSDAWTTTGGNQLMFTMGVNLAPSGATREVGLPGAGASGRQCAPGRGRGRHRNGSAMLERVDFEPLFFAPFVSSVMQVEPAWIDYNGHLNMAYYNVLFDRAVDEAFELLGCGLDYVKTRQHSCFTAEVHVRYLRELQRRRPGAGDVPAPRLRRQAHALFRAAVSCRGGLGVGHLREHVAARRHDGQEDRGFPPSVAQRLARMRAAHARLARCRKPPAGGRHPATDRRPKRAERFPTASPNTAARMPSLR